MKKIVLVLTGLLFYSCCLKIAFSEEEYWRDHAEKLHILEDKTISAIGIADNHLYIAAIENLFMSNLDGSSLVDVTQKIRKEPKDQITDILVDSSEKTLWLALNGSITSALSYSYALDIKQSQKDFLNRILQLSELLRDHAPQLSSINTLAFDNDRAIVGFFKGNVYLYSFKNKTYKLVYKPTSQYNWPVSAVLEGDTAFVAVAGDGLIVIVIDGKAINVSRFHDKPHDHIQTLAIHNRDLYIGTKGGVDKAKISNFVKLPVKK